MVGRESRQKGIHAGISRALDPAAAQLCCVAAESSALGKCIKGGEGERIYLTRVR